MDKKIKVYHILDHFVPEYSGYTFRTQYILRFQRKLGLEPTAIISPKYSEGLRHYEIINEIPCLRSIMEQNRLIKKVPFLREKLLMNHFQQDIFKIISQDSADIIHAHSPILCGLPAYAVAKRLKLPFIYEVRALWEDAAVDLGKTQEGSFRYSVTRYLETSLLKKADKIITICDSLKKEMVKRGIEEEKIHVIVNGVDIEEFSPQPKDAELVSRYQLANKIILGFIGSFYKYEGLSLLIEAMPKILSRVDNVVLMLIGQGNEESALKELARKTAIMDKVIFPGQVPNAKVTDYYSLIDIFTYPRESIRLTELTTPLKPLEAMAMEKAVIGSDVGGIKELICAGKNGLLFKAGDATDLADKCLRLIHDARLRIALGKSGREYVIENRNWEKLILRHLDIYQKLSGVSNEGN